MVQFDSITDEERKKVAQEAAPLLIQLQGVDLGGTRTPMVLGNSMVEEMITPEWVAAEGSDAANQAKSLQPTGQTVSLVETRSNNDGTSSSVVGYVRHATGTGRDGDALQITAVSGSAIAGSIRAGLEWIEANVPGNPTVRVLTAPAYQLTALGLYTDNELTGVLIVTPLSGNLSIRNEQVLTPAELRDRLRGFAPIQGLEA